MMIPFYRWRMICYCHWQVCRGDPAYAKAMEAEAADLERMQSK